MIRNLSIQKKIILWFAAAMVLIVLLMSAMTLAIGIEFVKMLCTHTSETVIEILLFAISRQMIVEHLSATETILGVGAIAGLFAVRKYLFCTIHKET